MQPEDRSINGPVASVEHRLQSAFPCTDKTRGAVQALVARFVVLDPIVDIIALTRSPGDPGLLASGAALVEA